MAIVPGGCASVRWEVPGAPPTGWDELTFPFTVHTISPGTGWFFAFQFKIGAHTCYIGMQPRNGMHQSTKFSVFGAGATLLDPDRCHGGADGGSGVTCSGWGPLLAGREYLFTARRDPGSRVWRGTFTDAVTGEIRPIGAWELPHGNGIAGTGQTAWMEFAASVPSCEDTPMATLHFGAPYHAPSGTVGRTWGPYDRGRCQGRSNYAAAAKADGRTWMRNGWPSTRRHHHSGDPRVRVTVNVTVNDRRQ